MREFFITARSFAAPFVSDTTEGYVQAETPEKALEVFAMTYTHPAGLYAAEAWENADAYHKGGTFLAQWLCNHEQAKRKATAGKGVYGYVGKGPGEFEVDGQTIKVLDPTGGSVVEGPA